MAERAIRSFTEKARSLLADANLPKFMWAECVSTTCYLSNLVTTRDLKKTSYELWYGKEPSIEHLRAFGYDAFVRISKQKRNKFDKKVRKGQLIGYGPSTKLYRIYFQDLQDVRIVRDVKFNEEKQNSFYVEDEMKSLSTSDETYELKKMILLKS
ncbi:Copia protein [Trachymyrmex zeteki]|uniref:Copia protein n=1 Tax=Mycetomoellerius zeteki TaxID=64791 RepID=A0A151XFH2_9HYME|nr:Copia protein [Trachymyrmex zeteki]